MSRAQDLADERENAQMVAASSQDLADAIRLLLGQGESQHDRDARTAMGAIVEADQGGERDYMPTEEARLRQHFATIDRQVRHAFDIADAMQAERTRRATKGAAK